MSVYVSVRKTLEYLPWFLSANFSLQISFIDVTSNTSFQYWVFGHRGCSNTGSVLLSHKQDAQEGDILSRRNEYVKDKTFGNIVSDYFAKLMITVS